MTLLGQGSLTSAENVNWQTLWTSFRVVGSSIDLYWMHFWNFYKVIIYVKSSVFMRLPLKMFNDFTNYTYFTLTFHNKNLYLTAILLTDNAWMSTGAMKTYFQMPINKISGIDQTMETSDWMVIDHDGDNLSRTIIEYKHSMLGFQCWSVT